MTNNLNLSAWAEIDLDAVVNNFNVLSELLPAGTKKAAVIKADAYGHGAKQIACVLAELADYFAVARISEAVELRTSILKEEKILVLGRTSPTHYPLLLEYDITPTIFSLEDAMLLNECAAKCQMTAKIHIAVDTGMARIGFSLCDESLESIKKIDSLDNIEIEGIFSHYSDSDNTEDDSFSVLQTERFKDFTEKLTSMGVNVPVRHIFNSAAISEFRSEFEMVREGIYLYGLKPFVSKNKDIIQKLRPVMSLKAEVIHVHSKAKGVPVSYGCTYVTEKECKIATLSIGYADGVPRKLSNKGCVLINGKRAPIIGRVCMDLLMCDVTEIDDVEVGSVATLIGRDANEEITANDIADIAETIPYEIVCGVSKRVPRVYFINGKIVSI